MQSAAPGLVMGDAQGSPLAPGWASRTPRGGRRRSRVGEGQAAEDPLWFQHLSDLGAVKECGACPWEAGFKSGPPTLHLLKLGSLPLSESQVSHL